MAHASQKKRSSRSMSNIKIDARPVERGKAETDLHADCPGREVFNHIVSRWGMLIILTLSGGALRFHVLRDDIEGVSEKMLSQTLKLLVRDGLVTRTVEPSVPPKVTYELSALGHEAASSLKQTVEWLGRHIPDFIGAQERFDAMRVLSDVKWPAVKM
jgi:DNA-binding HxlR family transcriptional regulator